MIISWDLRVGRMLERVQREKTLFINPRKHPQDYQAALESVGKGLITFDGCYFKVKESIERKKA